MEKIKQVLDLISPYISIIYMLSFIFLSYIVKKYFGTWLSKVTKLVWKPVYTVLIIATILAVPFIMTGTPWQVILFSYALGTTLHEVVFNILEDKGNELLQILFTNLKNKLTSKSKSNEFNTENKG